MPLTQLFYGFLHGWRYSIQTSKWKIPLLKAREKLRFTVIVADFKLPTKSRKRFWKKLKRNASDATLLRISARLKILDSNLQMEDTSCESPWKTESNNDTGYIFYWQIKIKMIEKQSSLVFNGCEQSESSSSRRTWSTTFQGFIFSLTRDSEIVHDQR